MVELSFSKNVLCIVDQGEALFASYLALVFRVARIWTNEQA